MHINERINRIIRALNEGKKVVLIAAGLGDITIKRTRYRYSINYNFLVPMPKQSYTFYITNERKLREFLYEQLRDPFTRVMIDREFVFE